MASPAKHPFLGYTLYVVLHKKEGRRIACLVNRESGHRTSMAYARYLVAVDVGRVLGQDEEVHHMDEDKLNDVLGNLELTAAGSHKRGHGAAAQHTILTRVCPVCRRAFFLRVSVAKTKTCSRSCGGKLSRRASNSLV